MISGVDQMPDHRTQTFYTIVDSPIGELLLVSDGHALRGLYMQGAHRPMRIAPWWESDAAPFIDVRAQLREYFAAERAVFDDVPLAMAGTSFERRVWHELQSIPYGNTASYGEIARRVGHPAAARAVGVANARNPVSVIVPCHRVIGASGRLTGYGGGLERKRLLLDQSCTTRPNRNFLKVNSSSASPSSRRIPTFIARRRTPVTTSRGSRCSTVRSRSGTFRK